MENAAVAGRPGFFATTFRAFHYRNFRVMWTGAFTSTTGTWLQEVAQSWLVYSLTGSTVLLGLTAFLAGAPILLFSLIGGVVADRMDRRRLLLFSQYTQMTSAFILALLVYFGKARVWHILVLTFVNGLAQAFGGPAYQALIPSLVAAQDLPNAIALMTIQFNLARVVGPVIAGFAIRWLGMAACFALNGLSFVAVIFSLLILHIEFVPKKSEDRILFSLREGLRFVYHHGSMLALIVLAFASTGLGVPLITFLPSFAKDIFKLGPQGYSTMLAFSGAGAVVGALIVAWMGHIARKGRAALLMLAAMGVFVMAFSQSHVYTLSCGILFLAGVSLIAVFAMISSLVQLLAPEELRGRILSVYNVAFRGGMPLGNLITGFLAKAYSPEWALLGNGVALFAVAVYFLGWQRGVRRL
ncbi:MAG: MFS transporter [Acidobacteria bacterium]|nr:MFS transporter [Acidobacteriota bacterium]